MDEITPELKEKRGLVAVTVTTGSITTETASALSEMRDWSSRNGLTAVEWRNFPALLVESARDQVAAHTLRQDYDWVLYIDADAAPFPPYALGRFLQIAYDIEPWVDVLGAYCQLKSPPYFPTIDTGTGTWQPEPAGQGTLPVIRTGGHFLFVKTPVFRKFGPPWFRSRQTLPALRALRDVDNLARTKFDGENPFADSEDWQELLRMYSGQKNEPGTVGEDSGFCDAVRAHGGHIAVDTDLVVGHIARKTVLPRDMIDALREKERRMYAKVGVADYF